MYIFTILLISSTISSLVSVPVDLDVYDDDNFIDDDDEKIDVSSILPLAYGDPDNATGEAVAAWSEGAPVNPEELGGYLQGDLLVPRGPARNGVKDTAYRWRDGVVPYVIEGHFSQQQLETIHRAIADYHRLTCVRFVPRRAEPDYLSLQSQSTGCWSSVGRLGGRQQVNLQAPGCVARKGTVLHELLHALGFAHEQSRPERDDFVTVRYENIKPGTEVNFRKSDAASSESFGVGYDYNSVMHYSDRAFSRNGQKTIEPKVGGVKLGQREGFSRSDVKKLNNMYNCRKDDLQTDGIIDVDLTDNNEATAKPGSSEPSQGWLGAIWHGLFSDV